MATKVPSNRQAGEAGTAKPDSPKLPIYRTLWVQVSMAMVAPRRWGPGTLGWRTGPPNLAAKPRLRSGHTFMPLPIRVGSARSVAHCSVAGLVDANRYPARIFLVEASTSG